MIQSEDDKPKADHSDPVITRKTKYVIIVMAILVMIVGGWYVVDKMMYRGMGVEQATKHVVEQLRQAREQARTESGLGEVRAVRIQPR